MEILSYKASDKELGRARKNLLETLAYWSNNWGYHIKEDLPEYVQDFYNVYCYSLWLEEQLAATKEQYEIFNRERQNMETPTKNIDKSPDGVDRPADTGKPSIPEHQHGSDHPANENGCRGTDDESGKSNLPISGEQE